MSGADSQHRLDTLQAGRAAAAFAVVLYHLDISTWGQPQYYPQELFVPFRMGHVGVEYFFVLSGFLMTWLYASRVGDRPAARRFLWKRALRVYPPYWVALLPTIPVYFLIPGAGTGNETDPLHIAASLFLLPTPGFPILSVAWTLQFEIFFYLMFAGVLAFPKLFKPLVALWVLAATVRLFTPEPVFPLSFLISPWILLFIYGAAAALLTRRGIPRPMLWVALGLALFAVSAIAGEYLGVARGFARNGLGIGAAMTVAGLVTAESQGRIHVPRWLVYGGDISYALYLVHTTVLSIGIKLIFKAGLKGLPAPVIAIGLIAASMIVAILLHEIVEKRLMKLRPKRSGANLGVEEPSAPRLRTQIPPSSPRP